ncbi:hypothetical protein B6F39_02770 [Mycobacterium tuberculosis variant bovis]|nr:hypothetical protein B6F39_02770 [Mycobacterium tuberculosis variant bovis]
MRPAHSDDAQTPAHPRPRPGLSHRHRTSTKPRRPPARPGAHPDRRGHRHPRPTTGSQRRPTAVLG